LVGASYSDDEGETGVIVKYLRDENLIECRPNQGHWIAPRGFMLADDLRSQRAASTQAFVAMWFASEMDAAFDSGIEPAVRLAGFDPMVIRKKEHANK
jgi:hypothetical protein